MEGGNRVSEQVSELTKFPVGIRLESVTFGYGSTPIVQEVSFAVPSGKLLTLLGPSGCGKTTLLKLIGGYLSPQAGRIELRGRDITSLPPEARNAGMVFQNYALFPHLSARGNVAFGLEVRRVNKEERKQRVQKMLDRVGLKADEQDRKPAELSGGQQQRVALARALVVEPDVLLLDEPLANLDRHLRDQLRTELRNLQKETGVTAVMVTHDQEEALAASDLIGVMSAGRILQIGPVADVYDRPQTPFVAKFLGAANLLDGKLVGHPTAVAMIRPEHCLLNPTPSTCRLAWNGRVLSVSFLGADLLVDVLCEYKISLRIRVRPDRLLATGDTVVVGIPDDRLWPVPEADSVELGLLPLG
jgi:ABC-type Fe3+/spermidine/putrescine transport system ATPase subunit